MPTSTSPIMAALPVQGLLIQVYSSGSPDTAFTIANAQDFNLPGKSTVVMTTNVGDTFARRTPTVVDPGAPSFKIFWIPEEVTHRNSIGGGGTATGLRYLWIQKLLRQFATIFPADANGNSPADSYLAYTTDFTVTGKVAGVFEAMITMGINDQAPSLV